MQAANKASEIRRCQRQEAENKSIDKIDKRCKAEIKALMKRMGVEGPSHSKKKSKKVDLLSASGSAQGTGSSASADETPCRNCGMMIRDMELHTKTCGTFHVLGEYEYLY